MIGRMLAQTYKIKRGSSFTRRILSILRDEKNNRNLSVDKLCDYQDRRRSEKVLRVLDNMLSSGENIVIAPHLPAQSTSSFDVMKMKEAKVEGEYSSLLRKVAFEDNKRVSAMFGEITNMVKEMQLLEKKDNSPKNLRDKNKLRKRYIKAVEKYQKEILQHRDETRQSHVSNCIKNLSNYTPYDKDVLKNRYKRAVMKYRLELYENRWKKEQKNNEVCVQRIEDLSNLLVELKLENCGLATHTEALKLKVCHLENHYMQTSKMLEDLSLTTEDKLACYQERINKAFDKLHDCKSNMKRKRKFFGRK